LDVDGHLRGYKTNLLLEDRHSRRIDAYSFMHDLAGRLANRIQLTTDGHRVYVDAVDSAFGSDIDYAMLVKL
jgi:hypothetical protein